MPLEVKLAVAADAADCLRMRGQTRQNAVSVARLAELGITVESWGADIASGALLGHVCRDDGGLVGYAFGDTRCGEVVVLALLADYEGKGLGRRLLELVVAQLRSLGHQRLFLGCSADPAVRSYGFYRQLGWRSTGRLDRLGDEELELRA